jgi:hypothetical protein
VDWYIWRVATSPKIRDSYAEICEQWSYEDLVHAHAVIDMLEEIDYMAHRDRE